MIILKITICLVISMCSLQLYALSEAEKARDERREFFYYRRHPEKGREKYLTQTLKDGLEDPVSFIKYEDVTPYLKNAREICPIYYNISKGFSINEDTYKIRIEKIIISQEFIDGIDSKIKNKDYFSREEMTFIWNLLAFHRRMYVFKDRLMKKERFHPLLAGTIRSLLEQGFIIDPDFIEIIKEKNEENRQKTIKREAEKALKTKKMRSKKIK